MSIAHTHKDILDTVSAYEKLLEQVTDELFVTTPAAGGWSYAEVFAHIFNSNITCIQAIDKCIQGAAVESDAGMSLGVRLVFFFKRFPPGKFKVPNRLKDQVKKINKQEAHELIRRFKDELSQITPLVGTARSNQKLKHPRLGLLNAVKWYEFIDIHTKHHRKQLVRISKGQ
ncbi:MAG TPA: DinB family protein [Chitinophagaceae bacterium]|nr:DinB family protein [Chitinophagaceae bacterium]